MVNVGVSVWRKQKPRGAQVRFFGSLPCGMKFSVGLDDSMEFVIPGK